MQLGQMKQYPPASSDSSTGATLHFPHMRSGHGRLAIVTGSSAHFLIVLRRVGEETDLRHLVQPNLHPDVTSRIMQVEPQYLQRVISGIG